MVIALGVFVVVVGLILGSYFAITALPDMMAQRELDKRLKDVSFTDASGETEDTSVLRKMVEGPMPGRKIISRPGRGGWRISPTRM